MVPSLASGSIQLPRLTTSCYKHRGSSGSFLRMLGRRRCEQPQILHLQQHNNYSQTQKQQNWQLSQPAETEGQRHDWQLLEHPWLLERHLVTCCHGMTLPSAACQLAVFECWQGEYQKQAYTLPTQSKRHWCSVAWRSGCPHLVNQHHLAWPGLFCVCMLASTSRGSLSQ